MKFIRKSIPWQKIEDQVVIIDSQNNQAHELCPVASHLWHQLATERNIEQLASNITEEYDVTYPDAVSDTQDFIKQLANWDLIDSIV